MSDLVARSDVLRMLKALGVGFDEFAKEAGVSARERRAMHEFLESLAREVEKLPAESGLPAGLDQALNSGDGTYRP